MLSTAVLPARPVSVSGMTLQHPFSDWTQNAARAKVILGEPICAGNEALLDPLKPRVIDNSASILREAEEPLLISINEKHGLTAPCRPLSA